MRIKWSLLTALSLVFILLFSGSVLAFQDVRGNPAEESIMALKHAGMVNGVDDHHFAPHGKVTYAQGVHFIVKGLKLDIDDLRFIKTAKASDYFTKVPDNAWYSSSFVIAHLNGLPVAKDADPHDIMTREQFAHLLMKAIMLKGNYVFIELYMLINDEQEITADYMNSIQKLLITKITELDDAKNFYPKREITRAEAAVWLHNAIKFVKAQANSAAEPPQQKDPQSNNSEVTINIEKINEEVNKVTLSWGKKPNSGYTISIAKIEFTQNDEAEIYYKLSFPQPGHSYMQVITEPKAHTFIDAKYKPKMKPLQ